jgi:CubicO group peptidase (beta-lactamase class C family)/D-alanyl-D-alanine dipeptidase
MIRPLRSVLLLVIGLGIAGVAHAAPPAPPTEAIAEAAQWEMREKAVPSIAIALVDRTGIVWSQAFGYADAEHKKPADAATIYRAGSVSKLFTDTAIMRLVEAGKLDLDAPVTRYLPGFHPHNPFGGAITLRELMTHRSGLVREPPRGHYFDTEAKGQADTVASLNDTTLVAAPGTLTKYSNAGLAVVGEVLATVTGEPYEQAVRDLVLAPLAMNASSMTLAPVKDRLAYSEMAAFDGPRFPAPPFDLGTPAAGNLYTTTGDLGRFVTAMLNHGQGLLKPATLDEMWRVQYPSNNGPRNFGLGFIVSDLDGQMMVGHSGAVYGFSTEVRLLPQAGIGAIVFSTVDSGVSASKLVRYALQAWLATRADKPVPAYVESVPVAGDEAKRLSGRFTNGSVSVNTRAYDGKLALDAPEMAGMVRKAGDHYLIDDAQALDEKLAFAPDGSWLELDGKRYVRSAWAEPPEPTPDFAALIGEYGWPHNILRIYQRDGVPFVRIEWVDYRPLRRIDADDYAFPTDRGLYSLEKLHFERGADGQPTAAILNGIRWPRRDFGAEAQAVVRQGVNGDVTALRTAALAVSPPVEAPKPRKADLVALTSLDPSIKLEIRYASDTNFMGVPVYQSAEAFMQRPAAEAVAQASQALHAQGYGLLIHDAYRPWFITKMFWDATPPDHHQFVADPSQGSRHNRGAAVDLTLYSLATGKPIVSTGRYDEFSDRSYSNYVGGTDRQRWLREKLRTAMESHGFQGYPTEWWHFDFGRWADYPIGNASFEQLRAAAK